MLNREKGAAPLYSQIADILKKRLRMASLYPGIPFIRKKICRKCFRSAGSLCVRR